MHMCSHPPRYARYARYARYLRDQKTVCVDPSDTVLHVVPFAAMISWLQQPHLQVDLHLLVTVLALEGDQRVSWVVGQDPRGRWPTDYFLWLLVVLNLVTDLLADGVPETKGWGTGPEAAHARHGELLL